MPATLAQLASNRARVIIGDPDGAHIFVDYRPGAITPRAVRAMRAVMGDSSTLTMEEATDAADDLTRFLASILIDWDLLDADGQPIPPTLDGLQDVDYETQGTILGAIMGDTRLGETTGARSSEPSVLPSKRAGKPATSRRPSQSGTASVPSRAGSA